MMDQPDSLIDPRLQRTHHFDWYVPPELKWEDPNDKDKWDSRSELAAAWRETPVPGQDEQVLLNALKEIYTEHRQRGVLLLAAAGSGKTVLTYMCEHVLSDKLSRQQIFGDTLPRLVLRWAKSNWPNVTTNGNQRELELLDLIEHDKVFQKFCEQQIQGSVGSSLARKLAEYALDNGRVAIIIDAWDELEVDQKKLFRQIHNEVIAKKVLLVVSSRDYAADQEASTFFATDAFRRLRIQPFGTGLQDEFMKLALKPFVHDWREQCLVGQGEDWDKQLGIPLVLRQLAVMINQANCANKPLPKFVSLSDLFVQTSNWMIEREFGEKDVNLEKRTIGGKVRSPERCRLILEPAMGAIAFELSVRGIWKEVAGANEIDAILEKNAKRRFITSSQAASAKGKRKIKAQWDWALERMGEFEINNGSLQAESNKEVLSFVTRHVQEMRCARFLTHYCTEQDLKDALQHNGDESWRDIWKGVIKMPVGQDDVDGYQRAIKILFTRPPADPKSGRQLHRRPTELMWEADLWIKAKMIQDYTNGRAFGEELREYLGTQFREYIQNPDEELRNAASSLIDLSNYVILSDTNNPNRVELSVETALRKLGRDKPFVTGELWDDQSEKGGWVKLTKFGISKYAVRNIQFHLFDDNFAESAISTSEKNHVRVLSGKNQPAVYLSWFDSFWFVVFVQNGRSSIARQKESAKEPCCGNSNDSLCIDNGKAQDKLQCSLPIDYENSLNGWTIVMPTELQFEYAYRAGLSFFNQHVQFNAEYFYAFETIETPVTESSKHYSNNREFLKREYQRPIPKLIDVDANTIRLYANCMNSTSIDVDQLYPNAFGLRLSGNCWKWLSHECISRFMPKRGGSWSTNYHHCKATHHDWDDPNSRRSNNGMILGLCWAI